MPYDVITLGETLFRLTPPHDQRFEQASTCEIHVGGTESNTAVGLARLGLQVAHLCRLPENALGHQAVNQLRGWGVDTSHIMWASEGRLGVYWLESGQSPRASQVIYDRQNSAASQMQISDLPPIFQADQARLFHTTGITAALSSTAYETVFYAIEQAKQLGWQVSFDLNYRAKLWSYAEALAACDPLLNMADILFFPIRDAVALFGLAQEDASEVAQFLAERYPQASIVLTLGDKGALCIYQGEIFTHTGFPLSTTLGRIGAGDSFVAGFLYSYLQGNPHSSNLAWGNACAALKYTIPGDMPILNKAEVEALVGNAAGGLSVRR